MSVPEFLLIVAVWYASGAIGGWLLLGIWWRKHLDVEVSDVIAAALWALLGPIFLVVGALFALGSLIPPIPDRVVWRKRESKRRTPVREGV